jgi:DNA mismatch repair protein MSH6
MSSRDTASTGSLKQKSLKSFFSKTPAGSKIPKTPAPKLLQKSVTSVSSASDAKNKSNIPRSLLEIDPKTPESRLTDLRALNSSAADSTRSVAWSHKAGSTPPTSDPIPIEQDEDEDVVMLSSKENHITSVSNIFIFKRVERENC